MEHISCSLFLLKDEKDKFFLIFAFDIHILTIQLKVFLMEVPEPRRIVCFASPPSLAAAAAPHYLGMGGAVNVTS